MTTATQDLVFKDVPVATPQQGVGAGQEEKDWTDYLGSIAEVGGGIAGAIAGGYLGAGSPAAIVGGYGIGSGLGRTLSGMASPFKEDMPDVRGGMADLARGATIGGKSIYEGIMQARERDKTSKSMSPPTVFRPQPSLSSGSGAYLTPREADMLSKTYQFGSGSPFLNPQIQNRL